jgi:hypothetical protein
MTRNTPRLGAPVAWETVVGYLGGALALAWAVRQLTRHSSESSVRGGMMPATGCPTNTYWSDYYGRCVSNIPQPPPVASFAVCDKNCRDEIAKAAGDTDYIHTLGGLVWYNTCMSKCGWGPAYP